MKEFQRDTGLLALKFGKGQGAQECRQPLEPEK